jgi:hypothetical protein
MSRRRLVATPAPFPSPSETTLGFHRPRGSAWPELRSISAIDPTPLIAAWVSARRASKPGNQHVPVAYLTCHPPSFRWKTDTHFRSIYEGAREKAEQFGFYLDEFSLADYPQDLRRLNSVLVTRGVQGLIVGPGLESHILSGLRWEHYALVTIGYALVAPAIHRVTEDHALGMKLAFEAALRAGHRRIGLSMTRHHNPARRERWLGSYLHEQYTRLRSTERIPVYLPDNERIAANSWRKKYHPDIILADDPAIWKDANVTTLCYALSAPDGSPGVHENNREIGRHAAQLLVSLVTSNTRGIPNVRQSVLVEPHVAFAASGQ